jgi:hypothetical protein
MPSIAKLSEGLVFRCLSICILRSVITTERILMQFIITDRVIQKKGFYVYTMHNSRETFKYQHCTRAKPGRVACKII